MSGPKGGRSAQSPQGDEGKIASRQGHGYRASCSTAPSSFSHRSQGKAKHTSNGSNPNFPRGGVIFGDLDDYNLLAPLNLSQKIKVKDQGGILSIESLSLGGPSGNPAHEIKNAKECDTNLNIKKGENKKLIQNEAAALFTNETDPSVRNTRRNISGRLINFQQYKKLPYVNEEEDQDPIQLDKVDWGRYYHSYNLGLRSKARRGQLRTWIGSFTRGTRSNAGRSLHGRHTGNRRVATMSRGSPRCMTRGTRWTVLYKCINAAQPLRIPDLPANPENE